MYTISVVTLIALLFIVQNTQCQINDLRLNRLFMLVHEEKLREEAAEREPGEHNHDLSSFFDQGLTGTDSFVPQQQQQQQQQFSQAQQFFPRQQSFQSFQPLSAQFQQKQPQPQFMSNSAFQQQQQQSNGQFMSNQQQKPMPQFMPNQPFQQQPQQQPQFNQFQQQLPQSQFNRFAQPPTQQSFQQFQKMPQSLNNFQQPSLAIQQQPVPQNLPQMPPNLMQSFSQFTPNSQIINDLATTSIKVAERIMNNKPVKSSSSSPSPLPSSSKTFDNNNNNVNKAGSSISKQLPPLTLKEVSQLKAPARFCPFKTIVKCDPEAPYRQTDGSCNNLGNLWWGQAETPFKRFIEADYSDQFKLNDPRASVDGSDLPNARDIACNLHEESEDIEPFISHMFMQWGQLINHDITSVSSSRDDDPDKTVCNTCTKSSKCLPIHVNQNASCTCRKRMSRDCIEFTRSSATFGDVSCTLGKREQLNLVTPWLDGSHIYGSNDAQLEKLRDRLTGGKGLLAVQKKALGKDMLPMQTTVRPTDCLDFTASTKCFHAGDDRVNQNPSLMSMQTLFVREHNRIANILSKLNPSWDDGIVFQEARRVIIAMIQQITYNEYLPILLGAKNMKKFSLLSQTGFEFFTGYNKSLDPRIANEYSAAAGRFGHSMVRSEYSRVNNNFTSAGHTSFLLRNSYFRANGLYDECQGGLESIVRGMLKDPLMKIDRHFTSDLTQHLFEVRDKFGRPFHFDLVSINIMRGRDHGIPSYTKHREFCGLPPIRTWTEMKQFISEETVNILKQFYRFVDDVDLFVAGVSENKEDGAIVGPTFSCLLGLQFQHLKFGDRFWYETADFPANFDPAQLNELRKITLSKLLCRTMQDTPMIQPLAMLTRQIDSNQLVSCDSLSDIDWQFWKSG